MIVKFHARGTGRGSGPVDYLLGKNQDRELATLERGDPKQIQELIDTSPYAKKYTSGVLSFQEANLPTETKNELIDLFEKALLPGLNKNQYSILWVEHLDKGRLELNFVVPNIELLSGKRLQPYFERADKPRINAWKNLINYAYGLHDPNDPINQRELVTPRDLPKTKQEALRAITDGLLSLSSSGEVKSRQDVLTALETAGFTVARQTKQSISIKNPDGGQNIRLKGMIYEQDFRFSEGLRGEIEAASERYRATAKERFDETLKFYRRGIGIKQEENQRRYSKTPFEPDMVSAKNMAMATADSFSRYCSGMGHDSSTKPHDSKALPRDSRSEEYDIFTSERDRKTNQFKTCPNESLRWTPLRENRSEIPRIQKQSRVHSLESHSTGLEHDRTRETVIERLRGFTDSVRDAAEGIYLRLREFRENVRDYFAGEQGNKTASTELERASESLKQSDKDLEELILNERDQGMERGEREMDF